MVEKATGVSKGKGRASVGERGEEAVVSAHALLPPDAETLEMLRMPVVAPSLTSIFPRFSYPDVNFWIWYASLSSPSLDPCSFGRQGIWEEVSRSYAWLGSQRTRGRHE